MTCVDVAAWLAGPGYNPVYAQCWIMHSYKNSVYVRIKGFSVPAWIPKHLIYNIKTEDTK